MSRRRRTTALLLAFLAGPAFAAPPEYTVDGTRSLFAVLTHKAGIASGLAHDHLVVAAQATTRLEFDPASPEATRFTFAAAVDALENVDRILGEFFEASGGLDRVLAKMAIVITGDHSQ